MKKSIVLIALSLTCFAGLAQDKKSEEKDRITKYVTTFPNGEEAISITDRSSSEVLKLASAEDFYKYEILQPSNHELVHGDVNNGKICDIDKSKLEEGTYTLKVYTDDFVITSDITVGEDKSESIQ